MSKKVLSLPLGLALLTALVVACTSGPPAAPRPLVLPAFDDRTTAPSGWWTDAVFYEVYVRAFQDSDGDGNGDLKGLLSRLDYLNDGNPATKNDLGVTALWLMPIFTSSSLHGYDTIDYRSIDKTLGTLDDFKLLVAEAKKRGIRIIVDLVLNHTSDRHEWFKQAAASASSPYADWYIISPKPTFGGSWSKLADGRRYYSNFGAGMPDLNYKNPAVTKEMLDITAFWLKETGIAGYRLDAIRHLVEDKGKTANSDATFEWLEGFWKTYKSINPEAYAVGEVWDDLETMAAYDEGKIDQAFHFDLAGALIESIMDHDNAKLSEVLNETKRVMAPGRYATFLRNHDQPRVMSEVGIETQARLAAAMQFTLPGTPYIYYGEEIGMMGTKPDPKIRRPMQWDTEKPYFGFTTGKPFGSKTPYTEGTNRSVANQTDDPKSLLSWYRGLIQLRQSHSFLRTGSLNLVATGNPAVMAWLRRDASGQALIVANLTNKPISAWSLSLWQGPFQGPLTLKPLWGQTPLAEVKGQVPALVPNAQGGFEAVRPVPSLAGYELAVWELK